MRHEFSVEIDRPVEQVFQLTNDDVSAWSIMCVADEPLETTPEVVGSTARVTTEENGHRMVFDAVVTEYEIPRLSSVQLTGPHFDLDVTYRFDDLGGRTRVTQISRVRPHGVMKLVVGAMSLLPRRKTPSGPSDELESLKRYCESQ